MVLDAVETAQEWHSVPRGASGRLRALRLVRELLMVEPAAGQNVGKT